jgi:O-antigen/teichoic acid export membrane protein
MLRKLRRVALSRPGLSVADQGVVSATGILTTLIVGRIAGAAELGTFALGLTVLLFVDEQLAALTSTPHLILAPARAGRARRKLAGSLFLQQAGLGVGAGLLVAGAALVVELVGGLGASRPALWAVAASLPLYVVAQGVRRYLFVELHFRSAFLADLLVAGLQLSGLAGLYLVDRLGGAEALCLLGAAKALGLAPVLLASGIDWGVSRRYILSHGLRAWKLGRWVVAASVLWSVTVQVYPWLLTLFHDVTAAGIWAAALSTANLMNPLLLGGQNFAGPRLVETYAQKSEEMARRYTWKVSLVFLGALTPLALGLTFWGGSLMVLIYGSEYAGQGWVVAVYGWAVVAAGVAFPISRALFAKERTDLDLGGSAASVISVSSGGLFLVYTFGPLGAAASALLSNVVGGVTRLVLLQLAGAGKSDRVPAEGGLAVES